MHFDPLGIVDPRPQFGPAFDPARAHSAPRHGEGATGGEDRREGARVHRLRAVNRVHEVTSAELTAPAALLASMIHRMGGAESSTSKGDYVDLTV